MDIVKAFYAVLISRDERMTDPVTGGRAVANNTSISEDLGQVRMARHAAHRPYVRACDSSRYIAVPCLYSCITQMGCQDMLRIPSSQHSYSQRAHLARLYPPWSAGLIPRAAPTTSPAATLIFVICTCGPRRPCLIPPNRRQRHVRVQQNGRLCCTMIDDWVSAHCPWAAIAVMPESKSAGIRQRKPRLRAAAPEPKLSSIRRRSGQANF